MRIVAISGSRPPKYEDQGAFGRLLDHGRAWADTLPTNGSLILFEGDAPGVDRVIGRYAAARGVWVQPVPAPWELFDQLGMRGSAGYARNDVLVQIAGEVYVFWDGSSRGTRDTIRRAIEADKLCGLWLPSGEVVRAPGTYWGDAIGQKGETIR